MFPARPAAWQESAAAVELQDPVTIPVKEETMPMACAQLNPHACKSYLLSFSGEKEVVLIDPVLDHLDDYLRLLEANAWKLRTVIDTHSHADHISASAALKDVIDCEYMMHADAPARCAGLRVTDGFEWRLPGGVPARVLHTPGHTRDSISLILDGRLFSGDALFLDDGGAGRDDLPGGDPRAHYDTLQKLASLPENLMVHPAHDYRGRRPSSLKRQKQTNPHLAPRSRREFIRYSEDLRLGPAEWMTDVLAANYACARDPRAAWIPVDTPACEVKGTLGPGVNEVQVAALSASLLRQKLNSAQPPRLLDVREAEELTGPLGHIAGSVHIPIGALTGRLDGLDAEKEWVVVCRSGSRAQTAAQILTVAGFARVSVLEGGMIAWNAG
jgi:sulfur dioxygenase